jgi:hypothetical protein
VTQSFVAGSVGGVRFDMNDEVAGLGALMVRDAVDSITDQLLEAVRASAPDVRVWVTAHDERVRKTHEDADTQVIPENLRFILDKPGTTSTELARAPRDPNLSQANSINCRCIDVDVPNVIATTFHRTDVEVLGPRTTAEVYSRFPRVIESEFPGQGDGGGGWAAGALNRVATAHRNVSARRT